ncbi:PAS domain S-box protein [Psychroserpens sp. AS72]|uniref:sensor histidine kinase n=1 Tax=Psychroserpens sp. AS72 TaxID=3135775 RepID=UPI00317AC9D0
MSLVKDKLFENIFTHAHGGIAIVSLEGKWLKVNKSICELFGYTEDELYSFSFQALTHRDDLDADLESMHQLTEGEIDNYQTEKRYFHKKGHVIWTLLSVSLVKDLEGKPLYFVSQIIDISAQKSANWHLQFLMNVVKGQNEKLNDFARIATHDIRTHVGNLSSLTEFLEEDITAIKNNENYKMLKESISNLDETIQHLNDIRLDEPKKYNSLNTLRLYDYVKKALYNISAIAKKEQCEIVNRVDKDVLILGIEAYLDSIILNFITNAIKYKSPNQTPIIEITTTTKDAFVILKIKDNGQGINLEKNKNKLFTLNGTFHKHHDSRGVGLYITKNHIESIGGKIEVESEVGVGTCFSIYLLKA